MDARELIAEGERLLEEATPGEWEQTPETYAGWVWVKRGPRTRGTGMIEFATRMRNAVLRVHADDQHVPHTPDYPQHERDAAFIVWARNNAATLLALAKSAESAKRAGRAEAFEEAASEMDDCAAEEERTGSSVSLHHADGHRNAAVLLRALAAKEREA